MKNQNKPEEIEKDIEYLDKEFPKGETKFRGQAMVLLALSRQVGEEEARKEFLEIIDKVWKERKWEHKTGAEPRAVVYDFLLILKKQLQELKNDK